MHKRGKLAEAEDLCKAVLNAYPNHPDCRHLLGVLRSQQGRNNEAFEHISATLKLQPRNAVALANFGLVLAKSGQLEQALASYDKALTIKPDYAEALNNRGNVLLGLKRFEEALASYDKALAIRPGNVETQTNRGVALKELKRLDEALAKKALALRPDHADALNSRGTGGARGAIGSPSLVSASLSLREACAEDLATVMRLERLPGYEGCVSRSEEAEHRAMLASPRYAYRLGLDAHGATQAFVILRDVYDPSGNLYVKRIVVAQPGCGIGTALLSLVLDEAFGPLLRAERVWLDCFADNTRALAAYGKLGFRREGYLVGAYRMPDGTRRDVVLMALLKRGREAERG